VNTKKSNQGNSTVRAKTLAEAIILQSIEDLWCENERSKCISFFTGEGFHICAKMAGMDFDEQVKVLNLVKNISNKIKNKKPASTGLRIKKGSYSAEAVLV
jgi:hypothetical protein